MGVFLFNYLYFCFKNRENAQSRPPAPVKKSKEWSKMVRKNVSLVKVMKNLIKLTVFLLIFVRYAFIMGISG